MYSVKIKIQRNPTKLKTKKKMHSFAEVRRKRRNIQIYVESDIVDFMIHY